MILAGWNQRNGPSTVRTRNKQPEVNVTAQLKVLAAEIELPKGIRVSAPCGRRARRTLDVDRPGACDQAKLLAQAQ